MRVVTRNMETIDGKRQIDTEGVSPEQRLRYRMLYIHPETVGLSDDPRKNPLHHLSAYFSGDYLAINCFGDPARTRELAQRITSASGEFRFHWLDTTRLPAVVRQVADLAFFIAKGLQLSLKHGRYDVIVAYGPYRTGFAGYILRLLTNSRLILEIPGNPRMTHQFDRSSIGRLKRSVGPRLVSFLTRRADHLRLRYPGQLSNADTHTSQVSVFPSFIPVETIPRSADTTERYIFFMGYPWHLKGVDVLIRAFNRISPKHPGVKLKIVGHCADRSPYITLAANNPNIEFHGPMPHDDAMRLMAGCSVFVLPSRTDAIARVLLEALAAERPVIASRVDGIPYYIQDGVTGLLFTPEDDAELSEKLHTLLSNGEVARSIARAGHMYVQSELSEKRYAETFRDMVELTLRPRSA